ncbi:MULTISPECIES: DUF945 family protein [unclassified Pseudoalteromonas]|uniref:DUF945 family protein n=1 Tax=unclassified Pseudoalteromonas TaxID=194690 RepID=UPI000403039A|nr:MULTISPECIES: DUF945 family protein [unclassified Pseudoalteromonas]
MKLKSLKLILPIAAIPLVSAIYFVPQYGYNIALKKLNNVDGVSANSNSFSLGLLKSTASTTVKIDKSKLGIFSDNLGDSQQLVLEVEHTINNFSYPIEVTHKAYFNEEISAKITDFLGIKDIEGPRFKVPVQLISQHSLSEQSIIGMTDHIQYGPNIELTPVKFFATLVDGSNNIEFQAKSDEIDLKASNSPATLNFKDANLTFNYDIESCATMCDGITNFKSANVTQYNEAGSLKFDATNIEVQTNVTIQDDTYSFSLATYAAEVETGTFNLRNFSINTVTSDIDMKAVDEFQASFAENQSADASPFHGKHNVTSMYARFLQSGMTFQINELHAETENGVINGSLKLKLPAKKMPDMVNNPMGVIKVLEGDFNLDIPLIDLDSITGVGSSNTLVQTGFAIKDKQNVKTEMSINEGIAVINGREITL